MYIRTVLRIGFGSSHNCLALYSMHQGIQHGISCYYMNPSHSLLQVVLLVPRLGRTRPNTGHHRAMSESSWGHLQGSLVPSFFIGCHLHGTLAKKKKKLFKPFYILHPYILYFSSVPLGSPCKTRPAQPFSLISRLPETALAPLVQSTMDDGSDIVDIFEDLDTDLIEIFHRGQQAAFFHHFPPQHDLQGLPNGSNPNQHPSQARNGYRYLYVRSRRLHSKFYWIWAYRYVPIPIINFPLIWRSLTTVAISEVFYKGFKLLVRLAVNLLRVMFVYMCLENEILRFFKCISTYNNIYTFSDNFYVDCIIYMFHDMQNITTIKKDLDWNDNNIFYFLDVDNNYNSMTNIQILKSLLANFIISKVDFKDCHPDPTNTSFVCDDKSLIFKFSRVFQNHYPSLSSKSNWLVSLKYVTLVCYMLYAFSGTLLSINALRFALMSISLKMRDMGGFYKNVVKLLWQSLGNLI